MGIRAVKYEAGEDHWEAKLSRLRDDEVYLQRLRYWMGTAYNLIWGSVPIFSLLATFFAFSKFQQGRLTPSIAFPALTVFNSLTQGPFPRILVKLSLTSTRPFALESGPYSLAPGFTSPRLSSVSSGLRAILRAPR